MMLDILPTEVTLSVLSHLFIPSLLSLPVLSRRWSDFFTTNQSAIFHTAAFLHEYIQPGMLLLEDALSVNTGTPWAGSTSWKDFCRRSFQLHKNWEGKGRAVARMLTPPGSDDYHIKVDEKAGICIATSLWGGLTVTHLFSGIVLWSLPASQVRICSHCEYDNGYLVFDNDHGVDGDSEREIWRLASDLSAEGEVAAHSPPDDQQLAVSAQAAEVYHHYSPLGHFRPWALLRFLEDMDAYYRLAYPMLISGGYERTVLHDVRTGSLVQTINHLNRPQVIGGVDVNERHAFVCSEYAVFVFSWESGSEILRIPADAIARCTQHVEDPALVSGDWFTSPLALSPQIDESPGNSRLVATRVSKDGRDLVALSDDRRVFFIRDFERICRGETTFEQAGLVLNIQSADRRSYLGFEHGRVCVASLQGLYIFTFGHDLSAKAVFVRLSKHPEPLWNCIGCVQLTDRRIYFTWADERRREDLPLIEDAENALGLPSPPFPPTLNPEVPLERPLGDQSERTSVGCIDFSLMPEGYVSEI